MYKVAVVDTPIRIGIKIAKIIEYNFNYRANALDYYAFSAGKFNTSYYNVFFLNIPVDSYQTLKLLEKLRKDESTKDCYIILLSSHFQKDLILEALKYGIIDIIFKPYDFDKIYEQLKSIFDKINSNQKLSESDYFNKPVLNKLSISSPEIDNIKQNYYLLIKDILRQEFRTKIKCDINFRDSNYDNIENAVIYKALYKSTNNKFYETALISSYEDILFLFSKLKNIKVDVYNYEILQSCDQFIQIVFNRILFLLKNILPDLQKISTNFAFYNNYISSDEDSFLLKFSTQYKNNFIFELKKLDSYIEPLF